MQKVSRYIVLFPLAVGLLTLLGWASGTEILKRPLGEVVAMNPMSALAFIFASLAFLLHTGGKKTGMLIAPVFAVAIGIIGLLKLIGVGRLSVDAWLFAGAIADEAAHGQINRMAPNSAFCFIMLSLAYMGGRLGHRRYLRDIPVYLSLIVFVVAVFSFVGFIFRVHDTYGVLSYLPMAVLSALSFLVLSLAMLLRHHDKAFMRVISSSNTGGRIARTLIPVAIFAPILLGYIRLYLFSWQYQLTVELGVAALTTSIIIVFLTVVWFISRALNVTDAARREAETELQRQAALFDLMPDAVVYGLRDLTITSMNKAAEDMFDIAARSATGRRVDDIMKIEVMGMTREDARLDLWGDKGMWKGEVVFTTLVGRKANSILTLKAIRDSEGVHTGFVGIYTDVTEFKRAEQRLEFVMESMGAGLWEWTFATDVRWWSPQYFALLGYRYNELEPSVETLRYLMHPEDADRALGAMRAHTYKREAFQLEVRIRRKDGTYRWFMTVGKTKFDSNDKPVSVIGSITDIDDRVRARQVIEQQAVLIQTIPDGIIYGTMDNRILSVNGGAQEMLGITEAEAIGHTLDELFTIKAIGTTREAARAEFTEHGYLRQEMEITNKIGEKITVLATVRRYEQLSDQKPGWICIYTDISPLRINEDLRAANRYLEQLAFIAAHDIKAPVQTLTGLTTLLLKSGTIGEADLQVLNMQKDVIDQMQRTNKGLNEILKLRQGLQAGVQAGERLPLRTIMQTAIATLQEKLDAAEAALSVDLTDAAEVELPFFYLQSVFQNLLSNAVKYRDPKRPLIIGVRALMLDRDTLSMTIGDNGIGIDMVRFGDKMFGMFKRFHPGIEGTGIGLNIVKSTIEAYGGTISVSSEVGQGALFAITLKTP